MVYKIENLFENSHTVNIPRLQKKIKSEHRDNCTFNFKDFLITHRQVCIPPSNKYQARLKEAKSHIQGPVLSCDVQAYYTTLTWKWGHWSSAGSFFFLRNGWIRLKETGRSYTEEIHSKSQWGLLKPKNRQIRALASLRHDKCSE